MVTKLVHCKEGLDVRLPADRSLAPHHSVNEKEHETIQNQVDCHLLQYHLSILNKFKQELQHTLAI